MANLMPSHNGYNIIIVCTFIESLCEHPQILFIWFHVLLDTLGIRQFFRHLEGQQYEQFYCKNHHVNCEIDTNQVAIHMNNKGFNFITLPKQVNTFCHTNARFAATAND